MAKKYEGDIVGWFYRNGKRIPIRGKSNKPDTYDVVPDKKPGRIIKGPEGQPEWQAKNRARIEELRDWDLFGERGSYTTRKRPKPVITKREPNKDKLRKNVDARGVKNKKLTWSEKYERDNRRKLMKERGVTNWKDVPDYLKQSTGTQTPGSTESLYGTSKKKTKKH